VGDQLPKLHVAGSTPVARSREIEELARTATSRARLVAVHHAGDAQNRMP